MLFLDVERRLLLCPSLYIKPRVPKEVLTKAKEGLINCRKVGDRWLRNSNMMKRCMQVPPPPGNLETSSIRSVACSNIKRKVIGYCIRSECQWRLEMCTNRGQMGVLGRERKNANLKWGHHGTAVRRMNKCSNIIPVSFTHI